MVVTAVLVLSSTLATTQINEQAPAITRDTVFIDAPVEQVWRALTDMGGWPSRYDFIKFVEPPMSLQPGERFRWHTTKLRLTSTLLTVRPQQQLTWLGGKYGVLVYHDWTMQPQATGTRVVSSESQQGLLVRPMKRRFQRQLTDGSRRWLHQLKAYCEQKPQPAP